MIAALAFLREHKRLALFAGAILAVFSSGYCAGRRSVRQPAVHEVVQKHAKMDVNSQVDTTAHAGPEKITITDFDVGPWAARGGAEARRPGTSAGTATSPSARGDSVPGYTAFCRPITVPGQDRIIRQTVIERGPTDTETHAQVATHEESTRRLDLTLSPAMLARSLALGVEDPFGAKKLHIEGGVMVTQHVGVRLGWTPADGLLKGLTPMAEFRF